MSIDIKTLSVSKIIKIMISESDSPTTGKEIIDIVKNTYKPKSKENSPIKIDVIDIDEDSDGTEIFVLAVEYTCP